MKNRVLITSVLLLSVIGVNRVFAQKYENNRYGLTLEKKENGYVLKDAKTIERLEVFDIEKTPADMFVPYKHKMRKLKSEDFNQCTTLHYVFKEYPNHKLVIEVDLPKNNKDKKIPYMVWIHGGGWHGGDCMGHKGISTYLASHGIAGIRVSYSFPSDGSNFKDSYQDLKDALNAGKRIIVTTLQKFPVIYEEVDDTTDKRFAIIVDEAHSSQTGSSAMKLKAALADVSDALKEYAELEGKAEDELLDDNERLVREMIAHGRHKNLSFFAFTATPKGATLEMFGTEWNDGSYHPFHVYSMRQAIEEGFILDVLQNYMTYST